MLKSILTAAIVVSGSIAATAQPLKPVQASTIDLGHTRGSAYYVVEPKGFRVIMTIETDGKPVRINTLLADGQSTSVSVPTAYGESPIEVTFARTADKLDVTRSVPADAVTASIE